MTRRLFLSFFCIFILFFESQWLFSEEFSDPDFGFYFDLPEGYSLSDFSDDELSYLFTHQVLPCSVVIKITIQKNSNSQNELKNCLKKLNSTSETASFEWNGFLCAISSFEMTLDQKYCGWAITAPLLKEDSFITMLSYATEETAKNYPQFIASSINSLCPDKKFIKSPGLLSTFAYPKEGKKEVSVKIAGKTINSQIDSGDEEASNFVINNEIEVLSLYAQSSHKIQAWKRYYRLIYRDNSSRIEKVIKQIIKTLYPLALKENPEHPENQIAAWTLEYVQKMKYERDKTNRADFANLCSIINGKGSDCDSRSLLVASIMNEAGFDSLLLVSDEFKHALVAVNLDAQGQKFTYNKKEYLMGETTAFITFGTISANHADRTKWFAVDFNFEF